MATINGMDAVDAMAALAEQIWEERRMKIDQLYQKTLSQLRGLRVKENSFNPRPITQGEEWGVRIWATKRVDGEK